MTALLPYRKLCMLLVSQSRFYWKNTKPRDFVVRGRWRMIIVSMVVMMTIDDCDDDDDFVHWGNGAVDDFI